MAATPLDAAGRKHGAERVYSPDGGVYAVQWRHGRKHGVEMQLNAQGMTVMYQEWNNGSEHGIQVLIAPNGRLRSLGFFRHGQYNGWYKIWDPVTGVLERASYYRRGECIRRIP